MTCMRARHALVDLDRGEAPRGALAKHLNGCASCRTLFRSLVSLETAVSDTASSSTGSRAADVAGFTERVMEAVHREHQARADAPANASIAGSPPAFGSWTAGGALIVCGLVITQFSAVVDWLRVGLGPVVDVALGTLFGIALTVYILILVGSNMSQVQRLMRLRPW